MAVGIVCSLPVAGLEVLPVSAANKVTICHRTHSATNPYRRITVSVNSVIPSGNSNQNNSKHGHDTGFHNTWSTAKWGSGLSQPPSMNVFDPDFHATTGYVGSDKKWGDIVPPVNNFAGLNWGAAGSAGQNIYNGTGTTAGGRSYAGLCKSMTAKQYYDSEVASGETPTDVLADLQEQNANEDASLKSTLPGGSFTNLTVQTVSQLATVDAVTNAPSNVAATSAGLNGTLAVGSATTTTSFQWGTDSTCSTGTSVAGTPATITSSGAVTANLTGLSAGTTYYYKVVGTMNAGTDNEGTIEGSCVSFVAAQGSGSDPSLTPPGGTTSGGSTTPSLTGPGGTVPNLPATGRGDGVVLLGAAFVFAGLLVLAPRRRRTL